MMGSVSGQLSSWLAYKLFRSPFARRSRRFHNLVMKLFRHSAERGNRKALATYGSLLHFRGGDDASRKQGALYIKAAAEQGDTRSLWLLGQIYEQGCFPVIQQSDQWALETYEKAAGQEHPLAIRRLVEIYSQGELGQSVDSQKAAHWRSLQFDLPEAD